MFHHLCLSVLKHHFLESLFFANWVLLCSILNEFIIRINDDDDDEDDDNNNKL